MTKCRTIWISDIHLGTKGCKAAHLNAFLKAYKCEHLYLVGDIIDGWRIKSGGWYWPSLHNIVVRRILRKAEKEGTNVTYIAGNHDEFLREYISSVQTLEVGKIKIINEGYHTTADGRRIWMIHGDAYDGITHYHKWIAWLGDIGYNWLMSANHGINKIRKLLNLPYCSLSQAVKHKVKGAVNYMFEFETTVAQEAIKRKADGVVCGHVHKPEARKVETDDGEVMYYNCGDWVESCSALVEDYDGNIHIVQWAVIGHEDDNTDEDFDCN